MEHVVRSIAIIHPFRFKTNGWNISRGSNVPLNHTPSAFIYRLWSFKEYWSSIVMSEGSMEVIVVVL